MFIGHLNDQVKLAAIGIGNMTLNVFIFSFGFGMNSCIETFAS